uniref:Uncharacterized protein n=1 Tax=Anopheles braziliensis TaxID=58242 RepID=A0A2M3ZLU8_9DIPT
MEALVLVLLTVATLRLRSFFPLKIRYTRSEEVTLELEADIKTGCCAVFKGDFGRASNETTISSRTVDGANVGGRCVVRCGSEGCNDECSPNSKALVPLPDLIWLCLILVSCNALCFRYSWKCAFSSTPPVVGTLPPVATYAPINGILSVLETSVVNRLAVPVIGVNTSDLSTVETSC